MGGEVQTQPSSSRASGRESSESGSAFLYWKVFRRRAAVSSIACCGAGCRALCFAVVGYYVAARPKSQPC